MDIIVQKYGGTSVESKNKLEIVCNKIIEYSKKKLGLVIVVSAQGKTTNELIETALEYSKKPSKRELDLLLTTGELKTVALLSMMLNEKGYPSIGLTGEQAGIITDSNYGNAKIKTIYSENITKHLKEGLIVVVAGFQGIDKFGNITTLGRGGSDLSAVALASQLKAKRCEIYTDVDGIYTADPRVIKKSKLLKHISYDEMLEAATAGAKVLHNRSVNVSKKYDLKIQVRNSSSSKVGSIVSSKFDEEFEGKDMEENNVKFLTKNDNVSKITIIGDMLITNKDIAYNIFSIANEENVQIYMISFSELSINLIVDSPKAEDFMKLLHKRLVEKE